MFDGTPSKFKDWIFKFEQYAEITGLDGNHVEMAQYALTLLDKSASTWWQVTLRSQPNTLAVATL